MVILFCVISFYVAVCNVLHPWLLQHVPSNLLLCVVCYILGYCSVFLPICAVCSVLHPWLLLCVVCCGFVEL